MKLQCGDVAIITGASKGLGVCIAEELQKKGVNLVLSALPESSLELARIAESLKTDSNDVISVPIDVSDPNALQILVDTAVDHFGRIDVLINNAGFSFSFPFDKLNNEDIEKIIAVNLTAPIILSRLVIPTMLGNGRGHIVNIASILGLLPSAYQDMYATTKHGLVGFTRSLRSSVKDMQWPIGASVICTGFVDGTGIYHEMKEKYGVSAPKSIGSIHVDKFTKAVIDAIEMDLPDVVIMKGVPRIAAALQAIAPRIFEIIHSRMSPVTLFRMVAQAHVAERNKSID